MRLPLILTLPLAIFVWNISSLIWTLHWKCKTLDSERNSTKRYLSMYEAQKVPVHVRH
jgi:hypothetical protein